MGDSSSPTYAQDDPHMRKMEEEGVISAPNHAGKREILAGKQ